MRNFTETFLPILLALAICTILVGQHVLQKPVKVPEQKIQDKPTPDLSQRPPRGKMISIPPKTHLYPMPTTIVGAMVNDKPNFLAIAYAGACSYDPPMMMIGINKNHYTTEGILKNRTFTINIPSTDMLEVTDYIGIVSGRDVDKSKFFDVFYGELKTAPLIQGASVAMECKVLEIVDLKGTNYNIIGEVVNTWVDENILSKGVPDLSKIDPIIFSMFQNKYWKLGPQIGSAWNDGARYADKHNLPKPKPQGH